MVEARGVLITTIIAALALVGLIGVAALRFSPSAIQEQTCQSSRATASDCSR